MPDPLEREVRLDISPALDALEDLDKEFEKSAENAREVLTDEIEGAFRDIEIRDVDTDPLVESIQEAIEDGSETPVVVDQVEATGVTDAVTTAIEAGADTPAVVEGDASDVTGSINDAVEAAQTNVTLEADAGDIGPAIEDEIQSADAVVVINVDTTAAETAVEVLLSDIEDQPVSISVDVDTDEAEDNLVRFGGSAEEVGDELDGLQGATAGLNEGVGVLLGGTADLTETLGGVATKAGAVGGAVGALAGFIGFAATKAASTETAIRRLNDAFGAFSESFDHIDLNGFNGSLSELASLTGSSGSALRNAAADVGQYGASAGFAQDETAKVAQQILLLATRAVALKPSLGDAGDVASRLQRVLASGREQALVPYGISLDRVALAADAQAIALSHGRDEVTRFDRVAAAAQQVTAKLGDTLGNDIAKGADDAELSFRRLTQQVKSAISEAGKPLVAPLLDALTAATPALENAAAVFSKLAQAILPPLIPLLGLVSDGLAGIAKVLDTIPAPVITIGAAFLTLQQIVSRTGGVFQAFVSTFTLLTSPIGKVVLALAALGAVVDALGFLQEEEKESVLTTDAVAQAMFNLSSTAGSAVPPIKNFADAVAGFVEDIRKGGPEGAEFAKILRELGISTDEVAAALGGSDKAFNDFVQRTREQAIEQGFLSRANGVYVNGLNELRTTTQAAAKDEFDHIVQTGKLTDAQEKQVLANAKVNGTTVNYVKAVREATEIAARHTAVIDDQARKTALASEAFDDLTRAIIAGQDVDISSFSDRLHLTEEETQKIATEIKANVDQFINAFVAGLPKASEALASFNKGVGDAFNAVAQAAGGSAEDIKKAEDQKIAALDPQRFNEALQKQIEDIRNFRDNLKTLLAEGKTEIVAFLAQQGAEQGGVLAAQLVAAAPDVRDASNTLLAGLRDETQGATDDAREILRQLGIDAPALAGQAAKDSTTAYQQGLSLGPTTEAEMEAAAAAVRSNNPKISEEAAIAAAGGDQAFVDRFTVDDSAAAAMLQAAAEIKNKETATAQNAASASTTTTTSWANNLQLGASVTQGLGVASETFKNDTSVASSATVAGQNVGNKFGDGIADGMRNKRQVVISQAKLLVLDAHTGASNAGSPSEHLFFDLGTDLATALGEGLTASGAVAESAKAAVNQFVDAVSGVALPPLSLTAQSAGIGTLSPKTEQNFDFNVTVEVSGPVSQQQAQEIGAAIATGAQQQLLRRAVVSQVRVNV